MGVGFSSVGSGSVIISIELAVFDEKQYLTSSNVQPDLVRALRKRIGTNDSATEPAMVLSKRVT